jgi:hypothetical protein
VTKPAASGPDTVDDLVSRQCGVLTRAQALSCGMTPGGLRAKVAARRWQRTYPGIYVTFTGPLPPMTRVWAALLACGTGAAVSHHTAAWLDGLPIDADGCIHVTVPAARYVVAPAGVRVHRSRTRADNVHPTKLPPRTLVEATVLDLVDMAARVDDAIGLVARACQRRLTTPPRLLDAVRRRRNLRWRGLIIGALRDVAAGVQSLLELRYLRDVERRHGLPTGERQPAVRAGAQTLYRDVRYRKYRTLVELDGRLGHTEPEDRRRDARRDHAGLVDGEVTLRFGWADVTGTPCESARIVAAVLRRNGWRGAPRRCGPGCVV